MGDTEQGLKWWLRYIVVPLVVASVVALVALMNRDELPGPAPRPIGSPIISITDDIRDSEGNRIDKDSAPFKVRVSGEALNARPFFVYLVVDNGNGQYVEPVGSLGSNVDGPFSGYCYLGLRDDPGSLKQAYTVFAVVANREYEEYALLDRSTVLAKSNQLLLIRTQ